MAVPTSLASLSTTPEGNPPSGSENPFPELDNHLRAMYAFHAQNRDAIATKLNASAVSAFGLTLLDDPNAAAARNTLGIKQWATGEWVLSIAATAPAGTVAPNGGTIGNTASGATTRANADTADLFALLWNSTPNEFYPIQDSTGAASTRGASASADFAENKRFPLPSIQDGDALVAAVSTAVLTRVAGQNLSHTHTGATDESGNHRHGGVVMPTGGQGHGGELPLVANYNTSVTDINGLHTHTFTTNADGGSRNLAAGLMTRVYIAL